MSQRGLHVSILRFVIEIIISLNVCYLVSIAANWLKEQLRCNDVINKQMLWVIKVETKILSLTLFFHEP